MSVVCLQEVTTALFWTWYVGAIVTVGLGAWLGGRWGRRMGRR